MIGNKDKFGKPISYNSNQEDVMRNFIEIDCLKSKQIVEIAATNSGMFMIDRRRNAFKLNFSNPKIDVKVEVTVEKPIEKVWTVFKYLSLFTIFLFEKFFSSAQK